jgi:hypothetical protein
MISLIRRANLGVVLAVLLAVSVATVFWYVSKRPEREAARVIRSLGTIQLEKTHVEEVMNATPGLWTTGNVTNPRSNYTFFRRNDLLHRLRLAPVAGVMVHIGAEQGVIDEIQIFWEIGESGSAAQVRFFQVGNHEPECGKQICVRRRNGQDRRPWMIQIDASPSASAAERNKFLDFNTSCLSKIGGCKDAQELLPAR